MASAVLLYQCHDGAVPQGGFGLIFGLWLDGSSGKSQEALWLLRHLQTNFQLDRRARERICIL